MAYRKTGLHGLLFIHRRLPPASTGYCSSSLHGVMFIQPPPAIGHLASTGSCSSTPNRLGCGGLLWRSCSSSTNHFHTARVLFIHSQPTGWGGAYKRVAATGTVLPQPTNRLGQPTTSRARGSIDATTVSTHSTYRAHDSKGHCSSRGNPTGYVSHTRARCNASIDRLQ